MKINKNKQYVFFTILVLVLISLSVYIRERGIYESAMVEKVYEVYPTLEQQKGITLKSADYFTSAEDSEIVKKMVVNKGQVVNRILLVKNHHKNAQNLSFILFDIFDEQKEKHFPVEFSEMNLFKLNPFEWRIVKYSVQIPDDFEEGVYGGKIALRNQEEFFYSEGVNVAYAVAVEFSFEVVKEGAPEYQYKAFLNEDITLHSLAMKYVYDDLKKVSSILFAVLALVFLYKAVVFDKKKNTRKKS